MSLPPGLSTRPLVLADAAAVTAIMAAEELRDTGEVGIEEADVVADWQRPSFDIATRTVGVLDGGGLVAYAELSGRDRAHAAVDPAHHGRGDGTSGALGLYEKVGMEVTSVWLNRAIAVTADPAGVAPGGTAR